jgi:hypothetical protein
VRLVKRPGWCSSGKVPVDKPVQERLRARAQEYRLKQEAVRQRLDLVRRD